MTLHLLTIAGYPLLYMIWLMIFLNSRFGTFKDLSFSENSLELSRFSLYYSVVSEFSSVDGPVDDCGVVVSVGVVAPDGVVLGLVDGVT